MRVKMTQMLCKEDQEFHSRQLAPGRGWWRTDMKAFYL